MHGEQTAIASLPLEEAALNEPSLMPPRLCFRPAPGGPPALTARERDLVRLLAQGLTGRQIADTLSISEWTVKTHVQNLREKCGVHTRAAVVAVCREEVQKP